MRPWMFGLCMALVACSGDKGSDGSVDDTGVIGDDDDDTVGDDDDDTTTECTVLVENDLTDPLTLMRDDDHYCESQPLYNPDVNTASAHWYGEMTIDDCGVVTGREVVLLFPNPQWESNGAADCMAVWDVSGVVDEPQGGADYGLSVTLTRNYADSDCPEDPYESPEIDSTHYNVHLDAGTARFYFDGSTEPFAEGFGNESHFNWFFDSCPLL